MKRYSKPVIYHYQVAQWFLANAILTEHLWNQENWNKIHNGLCILAEWLRPSTQNKQ